MHRAVRVIVADKEDKLLVQKRSMSKDINPGYWELGVGETVKSGEEYDEVAVRGLGEEAGIRPNPKKLRMLFKMKFRAKRDNANYRVYEYKYDETIDGAVTAQKEEVDELKFVAKSDLERLIQTGPFEPASIPQFKKYLELTKATK